MKILKYAVMVVFLTFSLASESLAVNFNSGTYEVTTSMELPGMQVNRKSKEDKHSECMTEKDLLMEGFKKDGCNLLSDNSSGDTLRFEFNNCHFNDIIGISTDITYFGDSFNGFMLYHSSTGNTLKINIKGKRLGDCNS